MNVDGIKALVRLQVEKDKLQKEVRREEVRQEDVARLNRFNTQSQERIKSFGFFERMITKRAEYSNVKQLEQSQIERRNADISKLEESQQDLGALERSLATVEQDMAYVQQEYQVPEVLANNLQMFELSPDGHLVIDISKLEDKYLRELKHQAVKDGKPQDFESNQLVMVHKTDLFPQNGKILTNFDGKKQHEEYTGMYLPNGQTKMPDCRQTSHYTLNRIVNSRSHTAYGTWNDAGICVMDEFSEHESEFAFINSADSYTRGSVILSDKSLIVVTEQVYNTLTEEQKKQQNIVIAKCQSDYEFDETIKTLLCLNGKPLLKGHNENKQHSNSIDMKYEKAWNKGGCALNFLRSEKDIFASGFTLDGEELSQFAYLVSKKGMPSIEHKYHDIKICCKNGQNVEVSKNLISSFLFAGLRKNEDGSFTRTDDYKALMDELEKLDQLGETDANRFSEQIYSFVINNGLAELQQKIDVIQQKFDSQPTPTVEEVLQMPISQIATFGNLKALQVAESLSIQSLTDETKTFSVSQDGLVVITTADIDSGKMREYVPTDDIQSVTKDQFIVPAVASEEEGAVPVERTLAESIEIANQVKILEPWRQAEMTSTETATALTTRII